MSAAPVRAAVLGAGSWGTTFAAVLADAGCEVTLWGRDASVVGQVADEHRNERYLPGVRLPDAVGATGDLRAAVEGAEVVAVAVPSQSAAAILAPLAGSLGDDAVAVSLMKGVELSTDRRMSELLAQTLGLPDERVAVVSGPNLAHEIAARQPTATVVASVDEGTALRVQAACATGYFRPYTNTDVVGVELCGAAKNVVALAVGVAQGRGYGHNTRATLVTRGLAEITRLGLALGADPATFAGLAGMGDLVATCGSPDSRNHVLGVHIGEGMTLDEALAHTNGTAEGAKSSRSLLELAQGLDVDVPITQGVVRVLYEGQDVDEMAAELLGRPHRPDGV
ncbi:NAD(P)H-dependent glycerol-3-phosphate dehydrogenase [Cellulomonas marina]|uniref:Glycerol-3-phosphate dehydrogenase [NAD(P)+] n=1 Tax=Cellulomonas marina TaxID=988821 RepID=A0A1I0YNF0_9CELL|nr:NAD(P)H-dependent glycerol-3-phosphate dehydrogenase [Cellulomonas marina]GIG27613.1 glycerol-3-phosphate dehydrogenase [NAD(P)+] [Cellulomonas marina]SFB14854.1 glycerol-3-phosphate dehydrogenase (NAD(P)+) [Cellulomonas marina]